MTKFEQEIYSYIKKNNGTKSAKDIANGVNMSQHKGQDQGEMIKITIERMVAAGESIECNYHGYRVKA